MKLVPIFLLSILILTIINMLCFILLFIYIKDKCQLIRLPNRDHYKKKKYDKQLDRNNQQLRKFILDLTKEDFDSNQ